MTEGYHVLVSPLGRSPGAVSGVYFGLQEQGTQIREVITVGTSNNDVWNSADYWLEPLFSTEPDATYRSRFIASEDLRGGERDVGPFTARMGLYIQQARDAGHIVHVAVTGGRSGMGALGALAAQLYGAHHLWHLWVAPEIEQNGTIDKLNPPEDRTNVYLNPTVQGKETWELVALPFVDLTPLHPIIRDYLCEGAVNPKTVPPAMLGFLDAEINEVHRRYFRELRELVEQRFDLEELRTLCADLGVDYDNLRGEGKAAKARELVAYLNRRERVSELANYVRQRRPTVSWPTLPGVPSAQLPLLHSLVQVGAGQLAQIFPSGLTIGAADRLVELTAVYKHASTDEKRFEVAMEVGRILQDAGVYDETVGRQMRDLVRLPVTSERVKSLITDAKKEDDVGFWNCVSVWLKENEQMFTVPVTVGKFLVDVAGLLIEFQKLP
jgi:hypothetical protein